MGKNHTVKDGECATSIAADNGFASVKDLFNHPDNAALRKLRPNPNLLAAGDVIVIPDHKPKTLALKADTKHKIVVTRPKAELHVYLRDLVGKKLKNASFKLTQGAASVSGVADGQGLIKVAIPPNLTSARLEIQLPAPPPPPAAKSDGLVLPTETFTVPATPKDPKKDYQPPKTLVWTLSIGSLGPAQVTTGAQRRLHNLGYACPINGSVDADTTSAVRAFQETVHATVSGALDDATVAALIKAHDQGTA